MSTPPRATVLVVEDSETTRRVLTTDLEHAGYRVVTAAEGEQAVEAVACEPVDVIALDVGLPGRDGWWVLERVREMDGDVAIIMLTAVADEPSKVRALRSGADDYVVKPVGRAELAARIEALLRRRRRWAPRDGRVFDDGRVRIDYASHDVRIGGRAVTLTPVEFRLLAALAARAGETLSVDDLAELVWADYTGDMRETLEVYVSYLRRKLGTDVVVAVDGAGYRFEPRS